MPGAVPPPPVVESADGSPQPFPTWGEVLQQRTDPSPGLVLAELQRAPLQQVRRQLPALEHRVL